MRVARLGVLLFAVACGRETPKGADSAATTATTSTQVSCTIDSTSIGGVRVATTLDSARKALPAATLARSSDGEGAALIDVTLDTVVMTLHALEDDAQAPIDWTKSVHSIETFYAGCSTANGIRPGLLVRDVEQVLGRVTRIVMSEIESRQYATFERQPEWLTLRIDYTGRFANGQRETTVFEPGARIVSISIVK